MSGVLADTSAGMLIELIEEHVPRPWTVHWAHTLRLLFCAWLRQLNVQQEIALPGKRQLNVQQEIALPGKT